MDISLKPLSFVILTVKLNLVGYLGNDLRFTKHTFLLQKCCQKSVRWTKRHASENIYSRT